MGLGGASILGHVGPLLVGASVASLAVSFAGIEPLEHSDAGPRADERKKWAGMLGGIVDGVLRRAGALLRRRLPDRVRARLDVKLEQAGEFLGLSAEEFLVASGALGVVTAAAALLATMEVLPTLLGLLLGAALPSLRLSARASERIRAADRELPAAIDLVAMCMAAGLDFPRAVRLVADNPIGGAVLPGELRRLLGDISLGSTRQASLLRLARRLPARGIEDFVAAAVQAERKGTPLAVVLEAQAGMSRMRRSVAAEEAASRAGVLLLVPLMLLMVCIVLLLVGPFLAGSGL